MLNKSPSLQVTAFVEKYRLKEEVMEMQALIEEIAALFQKIKAGTATLGELEAFAAATNQLNERSIVLRYKAYEAKVYGTPGTLDTKSASATIDELSEEAAHAEDAPVEETIAEVTPEAEESVEIGFDLFSMDDEAPAADPVIEEAETPTPEVFEEPEMEVEEEEITNELEEPVFETPDEPMFEAPESTIAPEVQEEMHHTTSGFSFEEEEPADEPEVFNEAPTQTIVQEPIVTSNFNEHPVLRKALTNDGTLQSRLLTVRLETLKSAFGLNERIQIVKELFNGSNEAYSTAIEQLDNQAEKSSARSLVNNLAHTYSWDVESDLAVEFVQKVERRYA